MKPPKRKTPKKGAAPKLSPEVLAAIDAFAEATGFEGIEALREYIHTKHSPVKSQPVDRIRWVPIEMVQPNDYNPNSVAKTEMGLLYTSILHDGYCVEQNTPILMADLSWQSAGTLKAGDQIIAFDEEATGPGDGLLEQRRYRTGTVTANALDNSPMVSVGTTRGNILVTPDHPFLAQKSHDGGYYGHEWVEAQDLTPGDRVCKFMEPWRRDTSWGAGWLAGFLDSESVMSQSWAGEHTHGLRLSAYQPPGTVKDRMLAAFGKYVEHHVDVIDRKSDGSGWSDMVMARVDRMSQLMKLLGMVRPPRILEDSGQFWDGVPCMPDAGGDPMPLVLSVVDAGEGTIARLGTNTRTYIADGFAVHNTQPVVTIWDDAAKKYVIVDGFHRYFTCRNNPDIRERNGGMLPIVVIEKDMNDRMASTVRHNRARGKHSIQGMANMVFKMLEEGWNDADICNELGMEAEELVRLKHITGFSKLFEGVDYKKAWQTRQQIKVRKEATGRAQAPVAPTTGAEQAAQSHDEVSGGSTPRRRSKPPQGRSVAPKGQPRKRSRT